MMHIMSATLSRLAELTEALNDHPEARRALLEEIAAAQEDAQGASRRSVLADRVERWRYQILNHWVEHRTAAVVEMAAHLDAVTVELRGGPSRPVRGVREAIAGASLDPELEAMLDPARPLDDLERQAAEETAKAFPGAGASGRRMHLYAPVYLSSHCINHCLYCGFRFPNEMTREHLDLKAALAEVDILQARGFRDLLVVAGEFPSKVTLDYLAEIIAAMADRGLFVSAEIAPLSTQGYATLRDAGTTGVTLYQETYDEPRYALYHPKGTKAWYDWRLEGPERAAEAGIARVGLGVLLGLGEPRAELAALIAHGRYLRGRFPGLQLAFSVPRLHETPEGFTTPYQVSDDLLRRIVCILRAAFPTSHVVLSTREAPALRDVMIGSAITQMSAGSTTSPGGYAATDAAGVQFPVSDDRSAAEVAALLLRSGMEVRWEPEPARSPSASPSAPHDPPQHAVASALSPRPHALL
jgi:2-iminoacetate synthase